MGVLKKLAGLSKIGKHMFFVSKNPYKLFNLRKLTKEDTRSLFELYVRSESYFRLVTGKPATIEDAENLFDSLPPGKEHHDKFVLGLMSDEGDVIACTDLIKDYPRDHAWCIGFFLVTPELRSFGFSSRIYYDLENFLRTKKVENLRLVVHEKNIGAYQFWTNKGFKKTQESYEMYGNEKVRVDVLEKKITPSSIKHTACNFKLFEQ